MAGHLWLGRCRPRLQLPVPEPVGEAKLEDYTKAGWDAEDVKQYLDAYYQNFNAPVMLPYLRITGTQEYYDILI